MKTITTELQSSASATSADSDWPASNVLTDYIGEKWQAASGNTATLTISISAGGCDTLALFGTNAESCSWTLKDSGGSTVTTGSVDLTSPSAVAQFWIEFAAQSGACSVELALTAAAGATIYAGVARAGIRAEFEEPQYGMQESRVDHSLVRQFSNGAKYVKKREIVRLFSGTIEMTREAEWASWHNAYENSGPNPRAWCILELVSDDNKYCVFGAQAQSPPEASHDWPNESVVSFHIEEAV